MSRYPNEAAACVVPNARATTDKLDPDDVPIPRSQPGAMKSDRGALFDHIVPYGGADANPGVLAASASALGLGGVPSESQVSR
jgi:hypothetical protein